MSSQPPNRSFTKADLEIFNLLDRPIWVFDIERKAMFWANKPALALWRANSLEELLARSFSHDMSESTSHRLNEYLRRFRLGERVEDSWTFYPNGKDPTPVCTRASGIHIDGGRLASLFDGENPKPNNYISQEVLREMEMLRHLPVAVGQFDANGVIMQQNPESLDLFGSQQSCEGEQSRESLVSSFVDRFNDKELGRQLFADVLDQGVDREIEAQLRTTRGMKWYTVKVRRSRDPVTAENVILYSARDISQVVEAKEEADRARHEADRANMEKSEFLAIMSHEIRTPLHQVIGWVQLLGQSKLNKEQGEYLELLDTSATSLMTVINDILDFTKLEVGKMSLDNTPFEPAGLLNGAMAAIAAKAESKGLVISTSISNEIPFVMGDPNRLRQILLNLLHNAVKFTDKGSVCLTASRLKDDDKGRVVFRIVVRDTGIGISEDHKQNIFKKYHQAHSSIARRYGGTGLGLEICKKLTELMGGKIGFESEFGEGSKFWIEIPFEAPLVGPEKRSHDANPWQPMRRLKVLVVDDNRINQKLAAKMLERLGHDVGLANNGLEAIEEVERGHYDVCLMDIQMPVLDGIEATKQLRKRGWDETKISIIGLTASYRTSDLSFYKQIGMNDCLGKPMQVKKLVKSIKAVAHRRKMGSNGLRD